MKRGKPLKRKTWMPQRRAKPRRSSRARNRAHLGIVHTLPCWLAATDKRHRCQGPMEADHAGRRGMGQKSHDHEAIPLCQRAHRQRTDWAGIFRPWGKERMRRWLEDGIAWTRAQLALGVPAPGGA